MTTEQRCDCEDKSNLLRVTRFVKSHSSPSVCEINIVSVTALDKIVDLIRLSNVRCVNCFYMFWFILSIRYLKRFNVWIIN